MKEEKKEGEGVAVRTFVFLLITIGVYLLLWQTVMPHVSLPVYYYGRLIELLGILLFIALAIFTPMRFEEMGILTDGATLRRSLALGGGVLALTLSGLFVVGRLQGGDPLFSLHVTGDISRITYIFVAPLQEVLAKSVMYYSFELVFEEKHPQLANLMSALTFGAFHVVYGIRMMLLAMALSLVTGWIFQHERAVWGCAVAHFACGFFPACFGF